MRQKFDPTTFDDGETVKDYTLHLKMGHWAREYRLKPKEQAHVTQDE
jgi:hypothetical protein